MVEGPTRNRINRQRGIGLATSKKGTTAPAKITRPRATEPVPRPRLFALLDQGNGQRITWIDGPPGAGKTTLLSSYLETRRLDHLWYQADAGDTDIATFFYYLGLAIQKSSRHRRQSLPAFAPEYLPGFLVFARRFAETLGAAVPPPAAIVFDNYETLPEDAAVHEAIREMALNLPLGLRIFILSRTAPPPAFARLRLHGDLAVLNAGELSLTPDEAVAFGVQRTGGEADPERIGRALRETGGWIAGFKLLLADWGAESSEPAEPGGSRQLAFDYFAGELFVHLPQTVQETLLRTALLPVMSEAQAERLTEDPGIGALLADLYRRNCFIVRRGHGEPCYEYHGLFRAFLLNRASAAIPPDEWHRLQRRAANLLAGTEQSEAAADLYRQAEDWQGLEALALLEAPAMIAAGRHRRLEDWFGYLPREAFRPRPWGLYWRAMARLPFDPAAARERFERAYAGFKAEDDPEGLYASWAGIMDSFFFEWQDLRPADRWIAEFEALRRRHPAFPSRAVELRTYLAMGTLAHRQPQHPFLPDWSEQALRLIDENEDRGMATLLGGYLIIRWLWRGEPGKAADLIERLGPRAAEPGFPPLIAILWSCAVALYHSVQGDLPACLAVVGQGLALAERTGLRCWDFLLCAQAARCSLVLGDLESADRWLSAMARTMRSHGRINGGFYNHLRSQAAAQRQEWHLALEHARTALAMTLEAGIPFLEAHCHIDLAKALLALRDGREWPEHLARAGSLAREMESRVLEYLVLETEAEAGFRDGREALALDRLARALALSRSMGGATWLLGGPARSARLYDRALAADIEAEHVRTLIRKRQLSPPDPYTAAETWPWPVRVYTLGRFVILVDGQPLPATRKAQNKPLELLKLLCTSGGQCLHEEQVADLLWPDAAGDAAEQSLEVALHRLRKLLRCGQAVRMEERRLCLDPRFIRVDCLAFDRIAHRPELTDRTTLQRAVGKYRGHFLPGESTAWVIPFRERLRAHYLRMVERLGMLLEREGDWFGAVECYAGAIEIEPLAELFYRRLMVCHARREQRAEVLSTYQRCRQALLSQLGLSPAPETQRLYNELLGL